MMFASAESALQGQDPGDSSEEALAIYADAANFQNNGAFDLAIDEWKKFIKEHGKDPLAPKAHHYLGVSYMRQANPNYLEAAASFQKALAGKKFELVEEALANRGWCLFNAGQADQSKQRQLFSEAQNAFATLLKKYPDSKSADQALFFSGEVSYAFGKPADAIGYYQRLTNLPGAKDSALYSDAFYATGVAQEDLQRWDDALSTYNSLEKVCKDKALLGEVQIRKGDILVRQEKFKEASSAFRAYADNKGELSDYALFRYAFCCVQLNDAASAADAYDELMKGYPQSQYAGAAMLSAGQSYYRAGKFDEAGEKFREVLKGQPGDATTEASHWLAQIALRNNKPEEAVSLARAAIKKGLEGFYAPQVKMDLADALSSTDAGAKEAVGIYADLSREKSGDPIGARALYNAAFTALRIRDLDLAGSMSDDFLKRYSKDPLVPDVLYISAEAKLQTSKYKEASQTYARLLSSAKDHPSRSLWIVRNATAQFLGGDYDGVIKNLPGSLAQLNSPAQKAEAEYLLGSSYFKRDKFAEAEKTLAASIRSSSKWPQAGEAMVTLGRAQLANKKAEAAGQTWKRVVSEFKDSNVADQARYRLAQAYSNKQEFDQANKYYQQILDGKKKNALTPYALYGAGWCLMKSEKFEAALKFLDQVLSDYKEHPVAAEAQLARGICMRRLGKDDQARSSLESFLQSGPQDMNLGHALFELALIEVDAKQHPKASAHLKRLVAEVPRYPELDKVLYELAWSMRDQGDEAAAIEHFGQLVVKFPNTRLAAEASYHVGQQQYEEGNFQRAANAFAKAADNSNDPVLIEKAHYKLGWAGYELENYEGARRSFEKQLEVSPTGPLSLDASVMIAESQFKEGLHEQALESYRQARQKILQNGKPERQKDPQSQQLRELIFLHGGQSAQQLKMWGDALQWFNQLRDQFPATSYLPQVFYETGYCYQQLKQPENALKFYSQVAGNYRNELAARARFMMGEIHFSSRSLSKAIPEFQRVMFGFGGEKAPEEIKNWQAKSAFEAGRCSELLVQNVTADKKPKALEIAEGFYQYVVEKHPDHDLVSKAATRLGALKR